MNSKRVNDFLFIIHNLFKSLSLRNNGSYSKCFKPCKKVIYDASFREMHQNVRLLEQNTSWVNFVLRYNDFDIETQEEYFIMGYKSLIASIGGFIGEPIF